LHPIAFISMDTLYFLSHSFCHIWLWSLARLHFNFLAYFPYFAKIKAGLWHYFAACVSVCSSQQAGITSKRQPLLGKGSINKFTWQWIQTQQ
jgi:hypothetical protein